MRPSRTLALVLTVDWLYRYVSLSAEARVGNATLLLLGSDLPMLDIVKTEVGLANSYFKASNEVSSFLEIEFARPIKVICHLTLFFIDGKEYLGGGTTRSPDSQIDINATYAPDGSLEVDKHETRRLLLEPTFGISRSILVSEGFAVAVEDKIDGKSYGGNPISGSVRDLKFSLRTSCSPKRELYRRVFSTL